MTENFDFAKVNKQAREFISRYARIQTAGNATGMPLQYYHDNMKSVNYTANANQFQQPSSEFIRTQLQWTGGAEQFNHAKINKLAQAMINIRKRSNSLTATMLRNELKNL